MEIIKIIEKGIASLFAQPLLYLSIILLIIVGFRRVKRERKSFSTRIYSPWLELRTFFSSSLIFGGLLSVITFFTGFSITVHWLVVFNVITMLVLIGSMFRLVSVAVTIGMSSLFFYICYYHDVKLVPFMKLNFNYKDLYVDNFMVAMTFFLALLLLFEGYLIQRYGAKNALPMLKKTARGKVAGAFQLRKLWFIPLLVFIPGTEMQKLFDWWPVFTIGAHSYSLIVLPIVIGFGKHIETALPNNISRKISSQVTILAVIIAMIGLLSIMMPTLTLFAFVLAVVARLWIAFRFYREEKYGRKCFVPLSDGLVILGARAGSPSERLNLLAGEKIIEVNGQKVNSRASLYKALNINRAFCKIKVIDLDGEPRIEQTALYANDPFELGLLLVEPR
ncbi:serine protease [Listeria sp. PSOL-1]|uniref:serine protease n=1 Tax=Listeria sp. PSOL-1 TaxID=1844999 RepID=UPI0013D486E9|nr:serine protease [Listeria sp. PSOL-1]